ncbi:MAG: hypothetical protein H6502_02630 [Candidatus Woesearchaeota archaeon]|nr:MAG: hypothetical protein H6502_02630 [Candidatus Woesearchaeota archaeon]
MNELMQFFPLEEKPLQETCFVDGGSALLFQTTNESKGLVRIATLLFAGKKRVKQTIVESEVDLQGTNPEEVLGKLREEKEKTAGKDFERVVYDGLSNPPKGISLCKTTQQHSNELSLLLAKKERFLCKDQHTYFVKLHPASSFIFKVIPASNLGEQDMVSYLEELASVSGDPAFIGYPYPLIAVDQLARISNVRRAQERLNVAAKKGAAWNALAKEDAHAHVHEILDSLEFEK